MGGAIGVNRNARAVEGDLNPSKLLIGTESKLGADVETTGRIESSNPAIAFNNTPPRNNLAPDVVTSPSSPSMPDMHEFEASDYSSRRVSNNQSRRYPSTLTRHAIEGQSGENDIENEMLDQTAMSLEMDREDLFFNLLYFGGGDMSNINTALSNAREETVALHSENNTPYKLRPASTTAIEELKSKSLLHLDELDSIDCSICKDDMEVGVEVVFLPNCAHCFHKECLIRWIKLQGFCPVCRANIVNEISEEVECDLELEELQSPRTSSNKIEEIRSDSEIEAFLELIRNTNALEDSEAEGIESPRITSNKFEERRRDSQLEAFLEDMSLSNALEDSGVECIEGYHYSTDEDDALLDQSDTRLDTLADKKHLDDSYYDSKKADKIDDILRSEVDEK
jgi:hypothetical protein